VDVLQSSIHARNVRLDFSLKMMGCVMPNTVNCHKPCLDFHYEHAVHATHTTSSTLPIDSVSYTTAIPLHATNPQSFLLDLDSLPERISSSKFFTAENCSKTTVVRHVRITGTPTCMCNGICAIRTIVRLGSCIIAQEIATTTSTTTFLLTILFVPLTIVNSTTLMVHA
jgi:hypothetical protein